MSNECNVWHQIPYLDDGSLLNTYVYMDADPKLKRLIISSPHDRSKNYVLNTATGLFTSSMEDEVSQLRYYIRKPMLEGSIYSVSYISRKPGKTIETDTLWCVLGQLIPPEQAELAIESIKLTGSYSEAVQFRDVMTVLQLTSCLHNPITY